MRADSARPDRLTILPLHPPTDLLNVRLVRGGPAEWRSIPIRGVQVNLVLDAPYRLHWMDGVNERNRLNLPNQTVVVIPGLSSRVWWIEPAHVLAASLSATLLQEATDGRAWELPGQGQLALQESSDPRVFHLMKVLQHEALAGWPGGRPFAEGLARTLAGCLSALVPRRALRAQARLLRAEVETVSEFLDAHLAADIGYRDLAALLGYSAHHFATLFRQATGLSPHQFILRRRIEHARRLLLSRDYAGLPVAAVAAAVGFASESHLGKVFRQLVGCTPGRYRQGAVAPPRLEKDRSNLTLCGRM